jgi:hypothetical protein
MNIALQNLRDWCSFERAILYSIKPMTKERQDQQRGAQANVVILAM